MFSALFIVWIYIVFPYADLIKTTWTILQKLYLTNIDLPKEMKSLFKTKSRLINGKA